MDYITELAAIAKEYGGIIETKIAAQHGISKAMLYKLCKEGGSPDLPICARSLLSRAEVDAGLAVQVAVERDVIVLRDLEHEAVD